MRVGKRNLENIRKNLKMPPNERVWRIVSRSLQSWVSTTHRSYSQLAFFIFCKKCSWSHRWHLTIWAYTPMYLVTYPHIVWASIRTDLRSIVYRSHLSRDPLLGATILAPLVLNTGQKLKVPNKPFHWSRGLLKGTTIILVPRGDETQRANVRW